MVNYHQSERLNRYLWFQHFKMEPVYSVRNVFHQGDWIAKLDLQDAYLSVYILHSQEVPKVPYNGEHKLTSSSVLSLGWLQLQKFFTKHMKPVVTCYRQQDTD